VHIFYGVIRGNRLRCVNQASCIKGIAKHCLVNVCAALFFYDTQSDLKNVSDLC
jgi:hypothetical protein